MVSTGGPPSSLPLSDLTGRMAIFGRLFGEQMGVAHPTEIPTPTALIDALREHVPRTSEPAGDAPVFEAAAFLGEWIRSFAEATWIAEGPFEPHLQVFDRSRGIVYLLPLVSLVRVASTAGYDGLAGLIEETMQDLLHPPGSAPLPDLRVVPHAETAAVVAWVDRHRHLQESGRAALWRRCSTCSTLVEDAITLHYVAEDWESDASTAAGMLARREFTCTCGGAPGEVSRFLLLRHKDGELRLADIHVSGTRTRIACWLIEGDAATPIDATTLSVGTVA